MLQNLGEFGCINLHIGGSFEKTLLLTDVFFPVEAAFSSGWVFPGLAPIAAKNTPLGWTSRDATKNTL